MRGSSTNNIDGEDLAAIVIAAGIIAAAIILKDANILWWLFILVLL